MSDIISRRVDAITAFDDIATTASKAMAIVTTNPNEAAWLIRNLADRLDAFPNRGDNNGGIDVA